MPRPRAGPFTCGVAAVRYRELVWLRCAQFFGIDEGWQRPAPTSWWRKDLLIAVCSWLLGVVLLQLTQVLTPLIAAPLWQQWLYLGIAASMLIIRRRYPVATAVLACAVLFLGSAWLPLLASQMYIQVTVFIALYSSMAWGRDRTVMLGVAVFVHVCLIMFVIWTFALHSGIETILRTIADETVTDHSPLTLSTTVVLISLLVNLMYINGAILLGTKAWWAARREALLAEQTVLLEQQSAAMAENAVHAERLRIARELHDVVAHRVAAIGVQAGAARRVHQRRGGDDEHQSVATALQHVEASSRDAVTEMRNLLGALREGTSPAIPANTSSTNEVDRSPASGPGLEGLSALAESLMAHRLVVTIDTVFHPAIPQSTIPAAIGVSLYRVVQEALSNVRAHSTATTARVTVRTDHGTFSTGTRVPFVEVEIIDDGRPRQGTSGTGMGQLGIRERARSFGGFADIGPRHVGGYRVRVRIPLHREDIS